MKTVLLLFLHIFYSFASYIPQQWEFVKDLQHREGLIFQVYRDIYGTEYLLKKNNLSAVASFDINELYLHREIRASNFLRHNYIDTVPLVLSMWGSEVPPSYLVFRYYPLGDLTRYLEVRNKMLNFNELRVIAKDVLSALKYLNSQGFVHHDIKIDNIVVSEEEKGQITAVKLIDLDSATSYQKFILRYGSLIYSSPELHHLYGRNETISPTLLETLAKTSDIYALGMSLIILALREYPIRLSTFRKVLLSEKFGLPMKIRTEFKCDLSDTSCLDFKNFVLRLLDFNYEKRMTVDQAMEHPFIAGYGYDGIDEPKTVGCFPFACLSRL